MGCHGVFQSAFKAIFQKGGAANAREHLDAALHALAGDELVEQDRLQPEEPFTFPDVPIGRIQGVRAAKSETWIARGETVTELTVAVLTTEPMLELSVWLMHQQEHTLWLAQDPNRRPLVALTTPRYSPVVEAIHKCVRMLEEPFGCDGPFHLLRGILAALNALNLNPNPTYDS